MPKRSKSLAAFIRDYLDDHGDAYVLELKRAHDEFCESNGYPCTSYDQVRSTVWMLRQLNLIEQSRTEPAGSGTIEDRRYYTLTPGAISRDWSDVRGQVDERRKTGTTRQ